MKDDASGEPFLFFTESPLVVLTGRKAKNLSELMHHLGEVSGSSVFYHTHYLYLTHHFEKPPFRNDFAGWTSQALQEERLAERLAAIDMLAMTSIRQLREKLEAATRSRLDGSDDRWRECPPGMEFHFCEVKSFIMPTGLVAHDVPELFAQLGQVSTSCLHFHFFEARLRLEKPTNDFSQWLTDRGENRLAQSINNLNAYAMTLDELKAEIVKVGRKYRRK